MWGQNGVCPDPPARRMHAPSSAFLPIVYWRHCRAHRASSSHASIARCIILCQHLNTGLSRRSRAMDISFISFSCLKQTVRISIFPLHSFLSACRRAFEAPAEHGQDGPEHPGVVHRPRGGCHLQALEWLRLSVGCWILWQGALLLLLLDNPSPPTFTPHPTPTPSRTRIVFFAPIKGTPYVFALQGQS